MKETSGVKMTEASVKEWISKDKSTPDQAASEREKEYFASTCHEGPFDLGPYSNPKDALTDAKEEFADQIAEGERVYIGVAEEVPLLLDGQSICENVADNYCSELYEDAFDSWCTKISQEAYDDLTTRLTKVFHEWLTEHKQTAVFKVINEINYKDTP